MKSIDQVREFHVLMGQPIGERPAFNERVRLRLDLIAEEFKELCEACGYECEVFISAPLVERKHEGGGRYYIGEHGPTDIVEAADALADLRYVTEGAALEWGIPLDAVTDEVHRSNMAKTGGPVRGDGKILKPPGWTPPDVAGVLARARSLPGVDVQPIPTSGDAEVWPLVLADIDARQKFGLEKYGVPLRTNDGRKSLVDAYQEALDLVVYLRKEIAERGAV